MNWAPVTAIALHRESLPEIVDQIPFSARSMERSNLDRCNMLQPLDWGNPLTHGFHGSHIEAQLFLQKFR
jgi:hypothetical protein